MTGQPEKWTLDGFLSHFMRVEKGRPDRSFAFLLGAGASKPSGIPTGAELVERWLNELHERFVEDRKALPLHDWATEENLEIQKFEYSRAAEFYPHVFECRFRGDPDEGYAYLEKIMEGVEPSFGYSVLAKILVNTRHSVVITTNFDDLVADALSMFAHKRPLVCGHESLTGFIRARMRRPVVAKIHRDLLLEPRNTQAGISELAVGWKEALARLLKSYELIAIGYGGNDGSLMGLLENVETKDLAGRIFWCYHEDHEPDRRVQNLLEAKNGVMVPIPGFDELMLLLNERLEFPLLADEIEKQGVARAKTYRDQFEATKAHLKQKREASEGAREASDAAARLAEKQTGWWGYELKAQSEPDPVKKEQIYRAGLGEFKDSHELMCNFANFLTDVRKNHDEAEELYRRALKLAPDEAIIMGNFAVFLAGVRKKHDEAEALYRRALELAPDNAHIMANLASLLQTVRKNYDEAENLYRRALELAPDGGLIMANFASFSLARGRISEAKEMAGQAWPLCVKDDIQVAAAVALDRGLISRIEQRDDAPALGRLKTMLSSDFQREGLSLDSEFAIAADKLSADDNRLYAALAGAILDGDKVAALEEFPRWKTAAPIDLDAPWPD